MGEVTIGVTVILPLKLPIFDSNLAISPQKIAYEKKIELGSPIGGIPDQTAKKLHLQTPQIYDFSVA